jgi:hypothetical protein
LALPKSGSKGCPGKTGISQPSTAPLDLFNFVNIILEYEAKCKGENVYKDINPERIKDRQAQFNGLAGLP